MKNLIVLEGVEHLKITIEKTPFAAKAPFPYILLSPALNNNLLQKIHDNFPAKKDLKPFDETGRVLPGCHRERLVLPLEDAWISQLPDQKKEFWNSFTHTCLHKGLIQCILKKLSPWTEQKILSASQSNSKAALFLDALAIEDQENYEIHPHTDSPSKLFSLLIYLPKSKNQAKLGTRFYKPKEVGFTCKKGIHYPFEYFIEFGRAEFLPNHGLLFPRTDNSFHGVPGLRLGNESRRSLQFNLKLAKTTDK